MSKYIHISFRIQIQNINVVLWIIEDMIFQFGFINPVKTQEYFSLLSLSLSQIFTFSTHEN